jgi:hypothetical protein
MHKCKGCEWFIDSAQEHCVECVAKFRAEDVLFFKEMDLRNEIKQLKVVNERLRKKLRALERMSDDTPQQA